MPSDNSFDVVSKVELQEVKNAIEQATKEVNARFDLKNSKSKIELEKEVKRGISLKNLEYEKLEQAAGQSVRQKIKLKQGIAGENAKKIVAAVKDSKLKVQASIQGETVRIVGKDKDALQQVMSKLRGGDFGVELQFTNFRSN